VVGGETIDEVTDRWGLRDGGATVEPKAEAEVEVRERYRAAARAARDLAS
jgi:hypothetical protein